MIVNPAVGYFPWQPEASDIISGVSYHLVISQGTYRGASAPFFMGFSREESQSAAPTSSTIAVEGGSSFSTTADRLILPSLPSI